MEAEKDKKTSRPEKIKKLAMISQNWATIF
jgi:hypothetical protein